MNLAEKNKVKLFDKINETEKSVTMQGSTYSGKDKDEKPIFSSWLVRFVGKAREKAEYLRKGDVIILNGARVDNQYNKNNGKSTGVITVFDFEFMKDEK